MALILDLQLLQTPARHRGMGQYLVSLLKAMGADAQFTAFDRVYAIFNAATDIDSDLKAEIHGALPTAEIVTLPLVVMELEKNTKKAQEQNERIISEWVAKNGLEDATFLMPSLFQAEVYPVFPAVRNKCVIMYDLIPLQMHGVYSKNMRWEDYLCRFEQLFMADRIFCISKTTSNALQVYAGVPARKLHVINGGPGAWPKPKKPKRKAPEKFVLMPTSNDIRKNNKNAVAGFAQFNAAHNNSYTLVVTSFFSEEEMRLLQTITPDLYFSGNLTNEELAWYFTNCEAVLFPTTLEGLGMPLLEAMLYDKPAAVSKIDVFEEISQDAPYYFNPFDEQSICKVLADAVAHKDFDTKRKLYPEILATYSWESTVTALFEGGFLEQASGYSEIKRKKVAVLCPYPGGISAIGKFVAEMHPVMSEKVDIEYYFEMPDPILELRPNVLGSFAPNWPVTAFNKKRYEEYDQVIYHIGNGKHHSITMSHALTMPGAVVMHDLNLKSIYEHLLHAHMIDQGRFDVEAELTKRKPKDCNFITTLVNSQKFLIVHSDHAEKIVKNHIIPGGGIEIVRANLPVQTPEYRIEKNDDSVFTIGLAGILANIKGLEIIEHIAMDSRFSHDRIMIFGLNFAEPGALDRLRAMPNVDIQTDLSDFTFQEKLKELSVFVNYRTHYQGEASSATLEAMRYGIPVIVRSDFGWYSELPDEAVVKVDGPEQISDKLNWLKNHRKQLKDIGDSARKTTQEQFNTDAYVDTILEAFWRQS